MPGNAFVYGTLMADEVVRLLIKRVPHSRAATLPGFSRHKIKGVVYPAIVPSEGTGARVQGKVLMDLSDKELHILDGECCPLLRGAQKARQRRHRAARPLPACTALPVVHAPCMALTHKPPPWHPLPVRCAVYEAEEYYRSTVEPELEDGSRVSADVYIWKDEFRWVC